MNKERIYTYHKLSVRKARQYNFLTGAETETRTRGAPLGQGKEKEARDVGKDERKLTLEGYEDERDRQ